MSDSDTKLTDDELGQLIEDAGGLFVDDGAEFYLNNMLLDSDNLSDALFEAWCLVRPGPGDERD